MRLINTETLEFGRFFGDSIPPYAILSHIAGFDEVSHQSYLAGERTERAGYEKIVQFCLFARSRGLGWAWIDNCCVDKKSSAELTEALNSHFEWFRSATECYAHLSDVPSLSSGEDAVMLAFERSRWFTRAWTLPELIAPKEVIFLNKEWEIMGMKSSGPLPQLRQASNGLGAGSQYVRGRSERFLNRDIQDITGIPQRFLEGEKLSRATVAERVSWARHRKSTRIEDLAYSLMGLFNVNMAPLYGEGTRSFQRLQDEITYKIGEPRLRRVESPGLQRGRLSRSTARYQEHEPASRFLPSVPRQADSETLEMPYVLTDRGFELRHVDRTRDDTQTGNYRYQTAAAHSSDASVTATNSVFPDPSENSKWRPCWLIVVLAGLIIGGSLAVGLYYSIAEDRMGDGFTTAGFMVAVGTLVLAVPITAHYPHCKCWRTSRRGSLGFRGILQSTS
ncbi:hypothetical protein LTR37_013618 [Vermiconidia calcicola]|uniref:Uncharacterized protein n=1 Tax=Vermiconidia calcicola TaxID=1690605 RepID=A0ACC3MVW3_9PEZI|nr:hypothetical protein LTR37_013618 [Vermiconidia calcicola]